MHSNEYIVGIQSFKNCVIVCGEIPWTKSPRTKSPDFTFLYNIKFSFAQGSYAQGGQAGCSEWTAIIFPNTGLAGQCWNHSVSVSWRLGLG